MVEKSQVTEIANDAKSMVDAAKDNPWFERLARFGYATRGLLYGVVGLLAFRLTLTGVGQLTDREGVLTTIAQQPFGEIMLIFVAVGLLGLASWGVISAVSDPHFKGTDASGIVARLGSFVVGVSYGALLIPTISLITGPDIQTGSSDETAQQATAGILALSGGPWVVGAAGLTIIGLGISTIYSGWSPSFVKRFDTYAMNSEQRSWAVRLGRIGYTAMGAVMITMGFLAVLAAVTLDPQQVGGFDAALTFLLVQPYGPWLLGAVALGLIAYAAYSVMGALWFKMKGKI